MQRIYFLVILVVASFFVSFAHANHLEQAKQFASTIPQLRGHEIAVSNLSGGLTNHIYLIKTADDTSYVLRVFGEEAESLGIDPSAQADIAISVGALNVGPRVAYFSADKKQMLFDFAAGKSLTREVYNEQVLAGLTSKLRRLHEHGNFRTVFDPFKTSNAFRQTALRKPPDIVASFPIADMDKAQQIMRQIQIAINPHSKQFMRSAHNDLHCGNILFDADSGTVSIIDLDYAGFADLFFDLAIFANSLALNSQESKELLVAYFVPRIPSTRDEAHLAIMRLVSTYWNSMWYFSQVGSSTIEHNHLQDAKDNLQDFLQQAATSPFKHWLKILAKDS